MTSLRVFGFKNRNLAGFSSGLEVLKTSKKLEKGSYVGDTATPRSVLEHNSQP
jgi:hypothetical protein